jgi:hypothetical protein
MLCDLISSRYAQIHSTFADKCGDVCCWEEDESEREVLHQSNVKAIVAVELDVGAMEKIKTWLVKPALWTERFSKLKSHREDWNSTYSWE